MATEIQNPSQFPVFVQDIEKILHFGEIEEVADEVAERLKSGILLVGKEVVHDIDELRSQTGVSAPSVKDRHKLPDSEQHVDREVEAHGMSIADSAIHDDPTKAQGDTNIPSIDDVKGDKPKTDEPKPEFPTPSVEPEQA